MPWPRPDADMRNRIVVLGALLILAGCADGAIESPVVRSVRETCPSKSDRAYYFAEGALSGAGTDGNASRAFYSEILRLLEEPSLSCGDLPDPAFRLLNVHAFGGGELIRVQRGLDGPTVTSISFNGSISGYRMESRRVRAILNRELDALATELERAGWWMQPTFYRPGFALALDGGSSLLEARAGNRYHETLLAVFPTYTPMDRVVKSMRSLGGFDGSSDVTRWQ